MNLPPGQTAWRRALMIGALGLGLLLSPSACGGGGGGEPGAGGSGIELVDLSYGRLADVFGLVEQGGVAGIQLYRSDVVIGIDIQDQRPTGSDKTDAEVLFDFLPPNPDSLQLRLLITREIGSPAFEQAFEELDRRLGRVSPAMFGQDTGTLPFSMVPRNAAIRLSFSGDLGLDPRFFADPPGDDGLVEVKNTTALQLLVIRGDPRDASPVGDFEQIPARVILRDDQLILDPVLIGNEGPQHGWRNNAAGMPASPNQEGANIRIALALEGPMRIPGLDDRGSQMVGVNHRGDRSIIRDFRSGNEDDESLQIVGGFVREQDPPRLLGEMLMRVARLETIGPTIQEVTLFKAGIEHEIDLGDAIRFVDPDDGSTLGVGEVIADPLDDRRQPGQQWVRVRIRRLPVLEASGAGAGDRDYDPSRRADYPDDLQERATWLMANGPRAALISEFTASRRDPGNGSVYGDDPANFVLFSPAALPLTDGTPSPSDQNVSPFAEAVIRFSKPVDLGTVRAFDTLFFATRDLLDEDLIAEEFLLPNKVDPDSFEMGKFWTPHLVASRIIDAGGSSTMIRLQPAMGFFLNEEMRQIDGGRPFEEQRFRYFLHLLGGASGIRDLSGNPVDFQSEVGGMDFLVVPFGIDVRKGAGGKPLQPDNLAVSVVRRFTTGDEDEQPSLYREGERVEIDDGSGAAQPTTVESYPLQDWFGAAHIERGRLRARETARVRQVVDSINQPKPVNSGVGRWCPPISGSIQPRATGARPYTAGIQNPLNPFGARLQAVWRELDLGLSRVDPFDFNLDVEGMFWAPFQGSPVTFDQFDRVSLFLGHSEKRPEPCQTGGSGGQATLSRSGLTVTFAENYAHDLDLQGNTELSPPPHPAYLDRVLTVDTWQTVHEGHGINRFLPLPEFQKPYFVWRDETLPVQGASSGLGSDSQGPEYGYAPYIISPWLSGNGRYVSQAAPGLPLRTDYGRWNTQRENAIGEPRYDSTTGGGAGSVVLPLLADFWTHCDDPGLPEGNGFIASGYNGWQISVPYYGWPQPYFRAFSGGSSGGLHGGDPVCIDPYHPNWNKARGGYTPGGSAVGAGADNSVYWVMLDFLKRQSVVTSGFVDVMDPHRMPPRAWGEGDPRLGPYLFEAGGEPVLPQNLLPRYDWISEPPLGRLPAGTAIVPEFRAASRLDPEPWRYTYVGVGHLGWSVAPDEQNFPLDPLKACDAGIRKYDLRELESTGQPRQHWAYYYNRQVTDYSRDISDLRNSSFTGQFGSGDERFEARDVRYFNWRFIMRNNTSALPAISPELESFAVTYRFELR